MGRKFTHAVYCTPYGRTTDARMGSRPCISFTHILNVLMGILHILCLGRIWVVVPELVHGLEPASQAQAPGHARLHVWVDNLKIGHGSSIQNSNTNRTTSTCTGTSTESEF